MSTLKISCLTLFTQLQLYLTSTALSSTTS